MIKFFRHIRKSLIEKNKMGKYFKYAIGEILLVVIGILIALQINNWNETRKDTIKAKSYLLNIKEDLKKDTTAYNAAIGSLKSTLPDTEFLLSIKDFKTLKYDSLYNSLPTVYYEISINSQTFDKLINSGITDLGDDTQLFDDINNYYTNISNNYYSVRNWDIKETNKEADFFFNQSFEIPNSYFNYYGIKTNFFSAKSPDENLATFSNMMRSVEARNKLKSAYFRKSRLFNTFEDIKKEAIKLLNKIDEKTQ
ncbi:DUF6090 family protein [Ichthyenterobacterium sp. W332]|uniref:DUF6090 family protein n=1 Tax=Microcosmobacter mediterraneus TaxID=3075607 RepID=A0ABU2YK82_9FLAO|nr:DUF6090 family protein [Ichthyenterobacterium sp. W332]MDT0558296.1 DUF6090 family protein [Ichthyenterobacterium sp. W332]